jgi:uncharacterized membrane protein YphA (DoxX/SURF4 family)
MNTIIWIIQGITALMFAMAGSMKLTQPKEKLVKSLPWVVDFSLPTVRFIGTSELLGATGLIVPMAANVLPILTPIAAIGLTVLMVLAASYHIRKNQYKEVMFNAVLFILSAIIAYARF